MKRDSPDLFLQALFAGHSQTIRTVAERVRTEAERLSGQISPIRRLAKKARLPRLGKALEA